MGDDRDDDIRRLHEDVARRRHYVKGPQRVSEALSTLLARRGYAQLTTAGAREQAWNSVVGEGLAARCRIGNIRRGVAEITVCNSVILQELSFRKRELLQGLAVALPDQKISDLRFRVGAVS